MEDLNMIAADCIVISCCCQCLILQVLIFIVLKLPYKLFKKTRDYARKLRDGRRRKKIMQTRCNELKGLRNSEDASLRVDVEGFFLNGSQGLGCCMGEVEKVLEEFSHRGEFAFGSFWNGEVSNRFPSCLANKEIDYDVHCHLKQIFGSNFNFREQEIIDAF